MPRKVPYKYGKWSGNHVDYQEAARYRIRPDRLPQNQGKVRGCRFTGGRCAFTAEISGWARPFVTGFFRPLETVFIVFFPGPPPPRIASFQTSITPSCKALRACLPRNKYLIT